VRHTFTPFFRRTRGAARLIALWFVTASVLHASCPPGGRSLLTGDAKQDDEARNRAKRFIAKRTTPVLLTMADLRQLQRETDPDASWRVRLLVPRRLRDLHAGRRTVSEGDRVSLTGYLQLAEEGPNRESVNCDGRDGRDIHLNVNASKPVTAYDEWTGIVIEVTPQVPLPGYGPKDHVAMLHALQAVMLAHRKILAVGSLTYDNQHQVNADRRRPNGSSPKRISLWELHPVLAFYVCPKGLSCDPETPNVTWQTLKEFSDGHIRRAFGRK
jgi:hypothetical protein